MSGWEAGSRKRNQPAPPTFVFDDLADPHRQPNKPWLVLEDDETEPSIADSERPNYVLWSSIWTKRPDARIRFDLDAAKGGTDLRWTLLLDGPAPEDRLLRHMFQRINQLIDANLRYTYGS